MYFLTCTSLSIFLCLLILTISFQVPLCIYFFSCPSSISLLVLLDSRIVLFWWFLNVVWLGITVVVALRHGVYSYCKELWGYYRCSIEPCPINPRNKWVMSFHHSFIQETWYIHICDMTHSCMWHDSSMYVTWLIHVCDMTHSYMRHHSLIQESWRIHDKPQLSYMNESWLSISWYQVSRAIACSI